MEDTLECRQERLRELSVLLNYVEREDWERAEHVMGIIDLAGFEVEGWIDLLKILRMYIGNRQKERSGGTIRLLIAELRAEY